MILRPCRWLAAGLVLLGATGCPDTEVPKLGGSRGGTVCATEDLIAFQEASSTEDREDLWIAFVDVGQGDAIWIRTPGAAGFEAKDILVDAGECDIASDDCGVRVPGANGVDGVGALLDFMRFSGWQAGRTIHYFVATHPDKDHYGGGLKVLETYEVDNFVASGIESDQSTYLRLLQGVADEPGITVLSPVAETGLDEGNWGRDVEVTLLSADKGASDDNGASVLLRLEFRGRRILLMADSEAALDERMVQRWGVDGLEANVLKAGHHGGQGTSTQVLLDAVFPNIEDNDQYAIISAGRRDNLPAAATLERLLAKVGERGLYRTDRGDEGKSTAQAPGDDTILLRVRPNGVMTVCYAFPD